MRYDRTAQPHDLGMADVGEKVRFLSCNGYATELAAARERLAEGEVLTVEDVSIGGWASYYRFVGRPGVYNTVMFEPIAESETHKPSPDHPSEIPVE